MKSFLFRSQSFGETVRFGCRLGKKLSAGTVVALTGNLGSGKTTLIQGLAKGLGVSKSEVKSPTFVLFHIYKGRIPVYHFDLYRLGNSAELEDIGFSEFISDGKAASVIEWAERGRALLPKDFLNIHLKDTGENTRELRIKAVGQESQKILQAFLKHEHSSH